MKKSIIKIDEKSIVKKQSFRLQTKEIFLTYPQCGDLELNFLRSELEKRLSTYTMKEFVLTREKHEDGGNHIHVFIITKKRTGIENEKYFDIEYKDKIFHPNIQPARKAGNVLEYILKFVISKFDENLIFSKGLTHRIDESATFMSIAESAIGLARAGLIHEALLLYEKEKPDFFVKNHMSLEKSFRGLFLKAQGAVAKFDFGKFVMPDGLKQDLSLAKAQNKSLFLLGEAGTGKTKFIESYCINILKLTPLIINNFDSIKKFDDNRHNAIIIDDICLKACDRSTVVKLLDSEDITTFRVTYGSVTIPANTPRFILSNIELKDLVNFELDEAITRRILVTNIGGLKLYEIK